MYWSASSLSNQRCLLQDAFTPTPHDHQIHHHGVAAEAGEEHGGGVPAGAADLMMLTAASCGPMLEDFLGGSGGEAAARLSGAGAEADAGAGVYDSELKTIAAGFLREFPAAQPEAEVGTTVAVAEPKKAADSFGQRTSTYRGVTRHRWTGRYEGHLWDNSCRREGQSRKGRQVYLGGYDEEVKAARAYDLAALKYWGPTTTTNFPVSNYEKELAEMKNMTRQEFVSSLRRKSTGFSRGSSIYRGVTRHHQHGRWQARIGRVAGNKDLYLGTFSTQEEAAQAYDIAAIKFRGLNAVTNFDMSRYDVKSIVASNLPIGGMAGKTSKASDTASSSSDARNVDAKPIDVREADQPGSSASLALPILLQRSQQHHDYRSLLALPHQQSQPASESNPSFNLAPSAVSMDISSATATLVSQGSGSFFLNCAMVQYQQQLQQQQQQQQQRQQTQQGQSNLCSIPYATPIALGSSYEAEGCGVTAVASPMHAHEQAAKASMGYSQTPIFGVE